jgi:hypothetical protein
MHTRIVTFRLAGRTHEHYLDAVTAIAHRFAAWPGLLTKVWIADPASATYGGVYLFASKDDADRSRETPEFAGLVSNPAFADLSISEFDVLAEPTAVTAGPLA